MKNKLKYLKVLIYIILVLFIIWIGYSVDWIKNVIFIIGVSFLISYSLKPFLKFLMRRGISRKKASVFIILTLVILTFINIFVLIPSIFKESLNLGDFLREIEYYFNSVYNNIQSFESNKTIDVILNKLRSMVSVYLFKLLDVLVEYIGKFGESVIQLIIVPIISYYFLADGEYIENKILLLFPVDTRKIIKNINRHIDKILGRYIISQFVLSLFVGIFTFIVLCILNVKFPLILSILNGVFNIIPYFGPVIGIIPAVIIALMESSKLAIYTFISLYIIQLIEGNIVSPKVTSNSVSIHPLGVIIILLIGGEIGGFIGMILAVPISVVIKVIYKDLNYYLF